MSIGIRYDISDRVVIQQFRRAFDLWAMLLDADFHEEQSASCAIASNETAMVDANCLPDGVWVTPANANKD